MQLSHLSSHTIVHDGIIQLNQRVRSGQPDRQSSQTNDSQVILSCQYLQKRLFVFINENAFCGNEDNDCYFKLIAAHSIVAFCETAIRIINSFVGFLRK